MKAKANNKSGGDFAPVPAGNHLGVCAGVIDLGTHWDTFQGNAARKIRKVQLVFEVEAKDEKNQDKRFWIGRDFNVGIDEDGSLQMGTKSHLRLLLEGWRGNPYGESEDIDINAVAGRSCLVNVIHTKKDDRTYSKVEAVKQLPPKTPAIKLTHPVIQYDADSEDEIPDEEWLPRVFGEKVVDVVDRCLEHGGNGLRTGESKNNGSGSSAAPGKSKTPAEEPEEAHTHADEVPF